LLIDRDPRSTGCGSAGGGAGFGPAPPVDRGRRRWGSLAELGELQLFRELCAFLGRLAKTYRIDWLHSRSRGFQIFCSGCPRCGDIPGDELDLGPWACDVRIGSFPLQLDAMWRGAMLEPGDERERAKAGFPKMASK
jgi:hypothetical protein